MLGYLGHLAATPFVNLWLIAASQSWRTLPRPVDAPLVHAPGSDPDRLLLIGSGVSVGYGVVSHDLSLGGHLARSLSGRTGRGASVDIVADPNMSPAGARAALGDAELERFDAIVLTLGGLEVLKLVPQRAWGRQIRDLLEYLSANAPTSVQVFVIGIPLLPGLPHWYAQIVRRQARVLNEQSRRACLRRRNVTYVAFAPSMGDVTDLPGRKSNHEWANLIAPTIANVLNRQTGMTGILRHPDNFDEELRQLAVDSLEIDFASDPEFEKLVGTVCALFGASGASLTIIDGEWQRLKASAGMELADQLRTNALCDLTIRRAELFVVEDTTSDSRVAATSWSSGTYFKFYAGYPIESPDGHRIGALCIIDAEPRQFSNRDAALLRDFALRVQSMIWGTPNSAEA